MKTYQAVIVSIIGLAASSAAMAETKITDSQYISASRCRGMATAMKMTDTSRLDAFLQAGAVAREPFILQRGAAEYKRAQQQTDMAKLNADYTAQCAAFGGSATTVAARPEPRS